MPIRSRFLLIFSSLLVLVSLLLAGCESASSGSSNSSGGNNLTSVSIGLGYIPDIQFAPFYVAQSKGYYKAAELNVTFHHGIVNDLIGSMVLGHDNLVFASGDEELVARSKKGRFVSS